MGTIYLMAQKEATAFLPPSKKYFHWQKHKKTLLRDELFQSLYAIKPTQSLKLGLAFDSSWRLKSLRVFHPTRAKNNKNHARKTLFDEERCSTARETLFLDVFSLPAIGPTGCWRGEGQGVKLAWTPWHSPPRHIRLANWLMAKCFSCFCLGLQVNKCLPFS